MVASSSWAGRADRARSAPSRTSCSRTDPAATLDVPASSLTAFLGAAPSDATDLPALGGELIAGRALVSVGDRVIAAERAYGSGSTTLIGFDPTVEWIAGGTAADTFWRRLLPQRLNAGLSLSDDSQLVGAVAQLPSLALPPIGGLFALLGAYILLVGPINYLVLRRIGRREWAWATIPALIAIFAVGAYAFGATPSRQRGHRQRDRPRPRRARRDRRDGTGLHRHLLPVTRHVPGARPGRGAPVSAGERRHVRDGRVRHRPRRPAGRPIARARPDGRLRVTADGAGRDGRSTCRSSRPTLRLEDGRLKGTVRNASDVTLERPAVVLGATVAILKDLEPGTEQTVDVAINGGANQFGQPLSDLVVGQLFFDGNGGNPDSETYIRHAVIDQLTFDPNFGSTNQLPADGAVILAWTSGSALAVEIEGQEPRRTGNTLYYLPTSVDVSGKTTFNNDLLRSSVVASDAAFFSKDPFSMNFGRGSATLAYRPIAMNGTIDDRRTR